MDLSIVVISESDNDFSIQFGSAGQRLYYSENQTLKAINGSRKKVGGYLKSKSQAVFETHEITLSKHAILYLCSDGFIDQHNMRRQRFGSTKFLELLEKIQHLPLVEQKELLQNTLQTHQEDQEQRDDITVIGLKL